MLFLRYPLGLISTIVIFTQSVWKENFGWDDELTSLLYDKWMNICSRLSSVNNIKINRLVLPKNKHVRIQLHGFSNASEKAYGACVHYIRSIDTYRVHSVKLWPKSKVAPSNQYSLACLELCDVLI